MGTQKGDLMAEHSMTDGWYRNARGNWCKSYGPARTPGARGDFPTPMIGADNIGKHVQSAADGKWYDSKSALRATYLPSGNPQGIRYNEVGNDVQSPPPVKDNTAAIDRAIGRAISRAS